MSNKNTSNNRRHDSSSNDRVPDWSRHLTEQLVSNPTHITPLSSSAIVVHPPDNRDQQFENYLDRQFTSNDAKVLKNRLSEATTLRNSSNVPGGNYWTSDLEKARPTRGMEEGGATEEGRPTIPHFDDRSDDSSNESNVWWVTKNDSDGFYSICGLLFLFGFVFPPFWWLGSVWPRHVREKGGKMAERWQKLNRLMSIGFSLILIVLIIIFVVLYATGTY